jgi:hypothetical protein
VHDQVLSTLEVTFCYAEDALLLLFFQNIFNLVLEVLDLLDPLVCLFGGYLSTDDLGTLFAARLDSLLDNLAVGLSGERTCATTSSSTGGTTDTMQVDLVALRGFVVDDCCDVLDIETTGGDVSGEEIRGCS